MKRLLLAIAAFALLLGACGDDDGGSAADLNEKEQELADEISASLQDSSDDTFAVNKEEADCVGAGMVSEIGADRLSQIDFEGGDVEFDLSEAEAGKAADVLVRCVDLSSSLAASIAADGEISQESAECLAGKFDDDTLKGIFAQVFQGQEPEQSGEFLRIITAGMTECLTDEEFAAITG